MDTSFQFGLRLGNDLARTFKYMRIYMNVKIDQSKLAGV